jgi:hypothetical protein
MPASTPILIEVAPGELLDKLAILQIKSERIDDAKRRNVLTELAVLEEARGRAVGTSAELTVLTADLKAVNERLWDIEDEIRDCERTGDFGARFIELARAVYMTTTAAPRSNTGSTSCSARVWWRRSPTRPTAEHEPPDMGHHGAGSSASVSDRPRARKSGLRWRRYLRQRPTELP